MKNLANMALLAIAALTFEACSSTRSTTGRTDTAAPSGSVSPATGDATGISSGNTTGSGTGTSGSGTMGSGSGTAGSTTTGSGSGTTGSGTTGSGSGTSGTNTGSGNTGTGAAGTTGTANTTSGGTSGTGNMGTGGAVSDETSQFIRQAAISGLSEVQLSNLALKNAQNTAVKKFAAMMVKDHGGANAELKTLASAKDIMLPDSSDIGDATSEINTAGSTGDTTGSGTTGSGTTGSGTAGSGSGATDNTSGGSNMSPAEKIERLRTSSNKEFDQNYVQLMIRDHVKAISLYETGARSADPQVKAYASKHLPALRKHLQQVTELGKTTIGKSGAQ